MRVLLVLLISVISCLFIVSRKVDRDRPFVLADGIEIYAVVPPEQMAELGGRRVLVVPRGRVTTVRLDRDGDQQLGIWLVLSNQATLEVGRAQHEWGIREWELRIPNRSSVRFVYWPPTMSGPYVLSVAGYPDARIRQFYESMRKPAE